MGKSRGVLTSEHDIRPESDAINLTTGQVLNGGPPNCVELGSLLEPGRDALLRDALARQVGPAVEEFTNTPRERGLPAHDLNRQFQSSNVTFLVDHRVRRYTSALVKVNKHPGRTAYKSSCIVSPMPTTARKVPVKATDRVRAAEIGADGSTIGERLRSVMILRGYDPDSGGQSRLARECQELYAAQFRTKGRQPPREMKQQQVGEILRGKQHNSYWLSIIATKLRVYPAWLQHGIEPRDMGPTEHEIHDRIAKLFRAENP